MKQSVLALSKAPFRAIYEIAYVGFNHRRY